MTTQKKKKVRKKEKIRNNFFEQILTKKTVH